MKYLNKSYLSIFLSCLTFITSVSVSYHYNGHFLNTVEITKLGFLGVVHEDILNFEIWRLATSQLIHVKYPHMIFNVIFLFLLSRQIEQKTNVKILMLLWFIAGGVGTYFSSLFAMPPWNIGTGSSQAILALAVSLLYLERKNILIDFYVKILAVIYILISMALDLVFIHYPKPGHVLSMLLGFLICKFFINKKNTAVSKVG